MTFPRFKLDPIISIFITVPIFFLLGWALQRYIFSRIENPEQTSVLVTFALALILEGVLGAIFQTNMPFGDTLLFNCHHHIIATFVYRLPAWRVFALPWSLFLFSITF